MSINKRTPFYLMLALLFGIVTMPPVFTYGPILEGKLRPVTEKSLLVYVIPVGEIQIRVWGKSYKIRECSFHHIDWFIRGTTGPDVKVPLIYEEKSKSRGDGGFNFGPWLLNMSEQEVRKQSYAYVYHDCHPFWLTRTLFYPS